MRKNFLSVFVQIPMLPQVFKKSLSLTKQLGRIMNHSKRALNNSARLTHNLSQASTPSKYVIPMASNALIRYNHNQNALVFHSKLYNSNLPTPRPSDALASACMFVVYQFCISQEHDLKHMSLNNCICILLF